MCVDCDKAYAERCKAEREGGEIYSEMIRPFRDLLSEGERKALDTYNKRLKPFNDAYAEARAKCKKSPEKLRIRASITQMWKDGVLSEESVKKLEAKYDLNGFLKYVLRSEKQKSIKNFVVRNIALEHVDRLNKKMGKNVFEIVENNIFDNLNKMGNNK